MLLIALLAAAQLGEPKATLNDRLLKAAYNRDLKTVERLLATGADARYVTQYGYTALIEAAIWGEVGIARVLLEHGAPIDQQDLSDGDSALMTAAARGYTPFVDFLLRRGANANLRGKRDGQTALMRAILMDSHDSESAALRLIPETNLTITDENGDTALHHAAASRLLAVAQTLIRDGANVNAADLRGYTPLHFIFVGNQSFSKGKAPAEDVVRLLLDSGADWDARRSGVTALFLAAERGEARTAQLLLDRGADPNIANQAGDTPLSVVADGRRGTLPDIASLLLEHGANVNARDAEGRTPLMRAAAANHLAHVKMFLQQGADRDLRDNKGKTAADYARDRAAGDVLALLQPVPLSNRDDLGARLMAAAIRGDAAAIEDLLHRGADVNYTSAGFSALAQASAAGAKEAVEVLILHGAQATSVDPAWSAIAIAAQQRDRSIFDSLLEHHLYNRHQLAEALLGTANDLHRTKRLLALGADPNEGKSLFGTALMLAAGAGCLPCVDALLEAGANPSAVVGFRTASSAASEGHHSAIVRRLDRAIGADPRQERAVLIAVLRALLVSNDPNVVYDLSFADGRPLPDNVLRVGADRIVSPEWIGMHSRARRVFVRIDFQWVTRDRAIVSTSTHCGLLCGSGVVWIVARSGSEWHVESRNQTWVS